MAHEVTVVIYDDRERSSEWWEEYLYAIIGNADCDIVNIETEEV